MKGRSGWRITVSLVNLLHRFRIEYDWDTSNGKGIRSLFSSMKNRNRQTNLFPGPFSSIKWTPQYRALWILLVKLDIIQFDWNF